MRLPLRKILSNSALAFGCFYFKSTPFSIGFLFAKLFFAGAITKKKRIKKISRELLSTAGN